MPGDRVGWLVAGLAIALVGTAFCWATWVERPRPNDIALGPALVTKEGIRSKPLAMKGGDPYLRALMRTISASESNSDHPYSVLYGGNYADRLNQHPGICVPIGLGINRGNCSTAAGRYQMLDVTWAEKAARYHPQRQKWWRSDRQSFEPIYQDWVVYRWLADRQAWGLDLRAALRQGQLDRVLRRLSGTWTSLGYGIESNRITPLLTATYRQILQDELRQAVSPAPNTNPTARPSAPGSPSPVPAPAKLPPQHP